MPIVQISARIIRWPEVCACCCRPADTTILVTATRTKGKRVIQTESKSWHVPYCSNCLEHIKVVQELKQFSTAVGHGSSLIALCGLIVAIIIYTSLDDNETSLAKVMTGLVVLATIGLILMTYPYFQRIYEEEKATREAEKQNLEQRLHMYRCSNCATLDVLAVEYNGWYGTVHEFSFANEEFAKLFKNMNKGKCL